jgi:hypothetical protein
MIRDILICKISFALMLTSDPALNCANLVIHGPGSALRNMNFSEQVCASLVTLTEIQDISLYLSSYSCYFNTVMLAVMCSWHPSLR